MLQSEVITESDTTWVSSWESDTTWVSSRDKDFNMHLRHIKMALDRLSEFGLKLSLRSVSSLRRK